MDHSIDAKDLPARLYGLMKEGNHTSNLNRTQEAGENPRLLRLLGNRAAIVKKVPKPTPMQS